MTRFLSRGWVLFMLAVVALGLLGLGYALWFKVITISSVVQTGRVHASIERAFTDDDDKVDSPLDSQDTEGCVDLGAVDVDGDGKTSCDPAATGPDPKPHYDKDVARCDASVDPDNNNVGHIWKRNVYPSYHCTAWFEIHNDGTIPVKIASAVATWACPDGTAGSAKLVPSTPILVDLDCDGVADASIHLTGVKICQQIDPSQRVLMDIDQHIEQGAPQGAELKYSVSVQFNQWNEPGPDCLEVDHFPNSQALIGVRLPDGSVQSMVLNGPTTVEVDLGMLGDGNGNGREEVPTELVMMELTGVGPLGPVRLRVMDESMGMIEENANNTPGVLDIPPFTAIGTAHSFFDVVFELEVAGMKLHNDKPARMDATITHKPPAPGDEYIKPAGVVIELLDENGNPTGIAIVEARHIPNPLPDITAKLINPPTAVVCFGDVGAIQCNATVEFEITNPSTVGVAGNFDVLIEADQVPDKTITVAGLAAGETKTFTETLGPGGNCYDPDCTVKVTADSGNAVAESDETNNSDTRTDLG